MADTLTIHNGAWVPMTRSELLELPWIQDAINSGRMLLINGWLGIHIGKIQEGGSIWDPAVNKPFYILKNTQKKTRPRVRKMAFSTEHERYEPEYTTDIETAELAYADGLCAIAFGKEYLYDKLGNLYD